MKDDPVPQEFLLDISREFNQDPWERDTLVVHPCARNSPAKFKFLSTHLQFYDVHFIDHFELSQIIIYPLLPFQSPRFLLEDTSRPVGHIVFRRIPNEETFTEGARAQGGKRHDERR